MRASLRRVTGDSAPAEPDRAVLPKFDGCRRVTMPFRRFYLPDSLRSSAARPRPSLMPRCTPRRTAGAILNSGVVRLCSGAMSLVVCASLSCGLPPTLTAPLGGDTAGETGSLFLVLVNNTDAIPSGRIGTFDPVSEDGQLDHFALGTGAGSLTLSPGEAFGAAPIECGRVFSVGGQRLVQRAAASEAAGGDADGAIDETTGVRFFADDAEDGAMPLAELRPLEALLAEDFSCGSVVVLRFEFDDAGDEVYRISFELIPSTGGR